MRCAITGHTSGIGQVIYNHFLSMGWEVVGLSRSTGYDLDIDFDKVVDAIKGADVFINNTGYKDYQYRLLKEVHASVGKIIVLGSIASDYKMGEYGQQKHLLELYCKKLNQEPTVKILYLKVSMLEDAVSCDQPITYSEVVDAVIWWLDHSRITQMDFELKLTDYTRNKIKENFGIIL